METPDEAPDDTNIRAEREELDRRLGIGPLDHDELPRAFQRLRHQVVNDHIGQVVLESRDREQDRRIAAADRAARKALDRIDSVIGVAGQAHIDGGGALGRLATQQAGQHIENQAALAENQATLTDLRDRGEQWGRRMQNLLIMGLGAFSLASVGWIIVLLHH